jgi:phosphoribosyl-ATP pyrophosphohydrolase
MGSDPNQPKGEQVMPQDGRYLDELYAVIASRRDGDPDTSYTAKLFAKGRAKIAQKVGEEAVETVVAAMGQGPGAVVSESADLLYHLLVLWADYGIAPDEIWAELSGRAGTSGIDEKKGRKRG